MTRYEEIFKMIGGEPTDDCILWPYADPNSRPQVNVGGKVLKIHRIICKKIHGEEACIGMVAAHLCGNRRCVNPLHIDPVPKIENERHRHVHETCSLTGPGALLKILLMRKQGLFDLSPREWLSWKRRTPEWREMNNRRRRLQREEAKAAV